MSHKFLSAFVCAEILAVVCMLALCEHMRHSPPHVPPLESLLPHTRCVMCWPPESEFERVFNSVCETFAKAIPDLEARTQAMRGKCLNLSMPKREQLKMLQHCPVDVLFHVYFDVCREGYSYHRLCEADPEVPDKFAVLGYVSD